MAKRTFDFLLALALIVILLPLMVLVAVSVAVDSGFPILYRQVRVGRAFRPFRICKFRTMRPEWREGGLQITVAGDHRITRVGGFLRRYKLDELPQLFNVLKGDMSFVGPRPEVEKYVAVYRKEYSELLKVRPGITDRSSIRFRSEEDLLGTRGNPEEHYLNVLLPQKIALSMESLKKSSFLSDLKIMLDTAMSVFG